MLISFFRTSSVVCREGWRDRSKSKANVSFTQRKEFEATDSRDKLYALIGIASNIDFTQRKAIVNYNKTEVEVFTSMTSLATDSEDSYAVLSYAGFKHGHFGSSSIMGC
jgi:hypothetical protein